MGTKNVVESRDFRPFRMAALNGLLELPRISLVGYFKSVGLENRAALGAIALLRARVLRPWGSGLWK